MSGGTGHASCDGLDHVINVRQCSHAGTIPVVAPLSLSIHVELRRTARKIGRPLDASRKRTAQRGSMCRKGYVRTLSHCCPQSVKDCRDVAGSAKHCGQTVFDARSHAPVGFSLDAHEETHPSKAEMRCALRS